MDTNLERLASNNPAVTIPVSSLLPAPNEIQGKRYTRRNDPRQLTPAPSSTTTATGIHANDTKVPTILSKHERGWRRIVRNFSPSWFSTTMGTGIVSLLFISIPFQHKATFYLSIVFFCLNLTIFSLATIISILRYTLYPEIWTVMIHDPTNSLFLGTIPMGFATLIEAFVFVCVPRWGPWATYLAFSLWILDAIASLLVTLSLSFILISQTHLQSLDRITAAQLLPIAATIVASGTGAEVSHALLELDPSTNSYPVRLALGTFLTSFVMWGMSLPFALVTLVIYYQRLTIHKLPPRETVVSVFLPLGPLGMGGYTIAYLGDLARDLLPFVPPFLTHIPMAGDIIYILTLFVALIMWSFGITWFVYAVSAILLTHNFPFNMGWWGFTFPLGVFAVSTIQLGVEFPSFFFRVLGTVFAGFVVALWIVVAIGTAKGAVSGELFYAPCLRNLKVEKDHDQEVGDGMEMEKGLGSGGAGARVQREKEKEEARRRMNNVVDDEDEDEEESRDRGDVDRKGEKEKGRDEIML